MGCLAGAALRSDYLGMLAAAGFRDVEIVRETDAYVLLAGVQCGDPLVASVVEAVGGIEEAHPLRNAASVAVSARNPA